MLLQADRALASSDTSLTKLYVSNGHTSGFALPSGGVREAGHGRYSSFSGEVTSCDRDYFNEMVSTVTPMAATKSPPMCNDLASAGICARTWQMQASSTHASLGIVGYLVGALRLELPLYVEVSTDTHANGRAILVVLLGGFLNGLGLVRRLGQLGLWAGMGAAVLGWVLWAAVIFVILGLLGYHRRGSLLRTLGFANAPSVLLLFGIVPGIGPVVRVVVVFWLLAATAVAIQAVYDVSRQRAVIISIVAFFIYLAIGVGVAHLAQS